MKNKKGFYAVFFVCMILVFGYGLILTMKNIDALKEARNNATVKSTMSHSKTQTGTTTPDSNIGVSKNDNKGDKGNGTTGTTTGKTDVATNTSKNQGEVADDGDKTTVFSPVEKMSRPVVGQLLKGFGDQYSDVTSEWSFNQGVDFAVKANEKILAALTGKVIKVGYEEDRGIYVILDHGNGLQTVYSNLGSKSMVKLGEVVKKGEPVSVASKTYSIGAFTDKPHVHFEVVQDGKRVNPIAKLPK